MASRRTFPLSFSKYFDLLASFGIGGAGLAITLAGSILKAQPIYALMAAAECGVAAILSLNGQSRLIADLFAKGEFLKRIKALAGGAAALIGMGVGTLAASVVLLSTR